MRLPQLLAIFCLTLLTACHSRNAYGQNVFLSVERDTGTVSIANSSGISGDLAAYEITSAMGSLDSSNWTPFSGSDTSWRVLGSPSQNKVSELKQFGSTTISQGSPVAIGSLFDPNSAKLAAGFGVDVEDLQVTFFDPVLDQVTSPPVEYVGEKFYNSLVLNIDVATGQANIENESPFDVHLTGYSIASDLGELNPNWEGLRSSDSTDWVEAGLSSASSLAELNQNPLAEALSLTAGSTASLGWVYTGDGSNQDLTFDFILQGSSTPLTSVVKYANLDFTGDANGDSLVDGYDFLLLQRTAPHLLDNWQGNFGSGPLAAVSTSKTQVPEPGSAWLLVFAVATAAFGQLRNSRQSGTYGLTEGGSHA